MNIRTTLFVCIFMLFITNIVQAQTVSEKDRELNEIANMLTEIQFYTQRMSQEASFGDRLGKALEGLAKMLYDFQEKTRNNRYVEITGFTVQAGFPMGISVGMHLNTLD